MNAVRNREQRPNSLPVQVKQGNVSADMRQAIERYVQHCFAEFYGADVEHFSPCLIALLDGEERIQAALGLRPAGHEPLFLERYLGTPVEQCLATSIGAPIDRAGIVEVGNLAASNAGGGRYLIATLTALLHAGHYEWVVFTIGPALQNTFQRMGLKLLDLGPAPAECLNEGERKAWGSYYDQKPRVMAGRIEEGYRVLREVCEKEQGLMNLWSQAKRIGGIAA